MMSEHGMIERFLSESFEDFKLSKEEKISLRSLLESLGSDNELLGFARNKAFDLYRGQPSTESYESSLNWLERVVKTIDGIRVAASIEKPSAHFSPGDHCADQIINQLLTARESIDICVFTISDDRITDAILRAHNNGRRVRIVSDNDKANDRGSDVYRLAEQGVPLRVDRSPHHMHHKFVIFDQRVLINGSFNWTRSASTKNEENIMVLYEPSLIEAFSSSFEMLWSDATVI